MHRPVDVGSTRLDELLSVLLAPALESAQVDA
jgi:hypothetical protein